MYIDFRKDSDYDKSIEELLRHIFNAPKHTRPDIGTPPTLDQMSKEKTPDLLDMPTFSAGNILAPTRPGQWDWTVFITGNEEDLSMVDFVEYTLHETFSEPIQIVRDRGTGKMAFPFSTNGWGTFRIFIRVFLRDGRIQILSHRLKFKRD